MVTEIKRNNINTLEIDRADVNSKREDPTRETRARERIITS